jgi:hypothetical protein
MSKSKRKSDPHPELALGGLPYAPAQRPAGVPAKGHAFPTAHEQAILRRAAQPGNAIVKTYRSDQAAVFVYADDGSIVRSVSGDRPLTAIEFARLVPWLIPQRDALFDFDTQSWRARRPEDG